VPSGHASGAQPSPPCSSDALCVAHALLASTRHPECKGQDTLAQEFLAALLGRVRSCSSQHQPAFIKAESPWPPCVTWVTVNCACAAPLYPLSPRPQMCQRGVRGRFQHPRSPCTYAPYSGGFPGYGPVSVLSICILPASRDVPQFSAWALAQHRPAHHQCTDPPAATTVSPFNRCPRAHSRPLLGHPRPPVVTTLHCRQTGLHKSWGVCHHSMHQTSSHLCNQTVLLAIMIGRVHNSPLILCHQAQTAATRCLR
jgi:hypothetical protein